MPPPDSPHAEPAPRKRRRKREDPQSCFTNSEEYDSDDASPVSCSDVESFQGKIVYNPDGSAYIIDSENDSLSNISENGLGTVNDYFGLGVPATNNPKIHSFRVVTARDATVNISEPNSKISKPILMCFICKLSFGNTKSFSLHAANEHALNLQECEKMLLNREYSSAIIQRNGDEKPQISFLEPLDVQKQMQHTIDQQSLSKSNDLAVKTLSDYHQSLITAASTASTTQSTNVSTSATTVATSNQISTENANSTTGNPASNSKFLSELFLQQQQLQQQRESTPLQCPDHQGMKGIDCKTCEMMNVSIKSPMTPIKSPNNLNMTPPGSSSVNMSPTTPAPSFTIGACPEHINGRPIGVECPRCELILNSARLNSGVQISTRNSCKTLKCPQCNWHYKYQETLEIHMREKHPDGESACGYCLAGQQHPRLARGESYTCGYKPYRCEICNYSTTTKGNLSIHMQSDKHLNNMQELNSTQSLSQTSEIRESPKIILPNMSQQSAKPKPSFRCDVCSYETSVARNLRIHMTSEKHTHNMAVLQNNIKHLQALSFLQSQNIGQLPSLNNMPNLPNLNQSIPNLQQNVPNLAQNLPNFLPEAALADLAYNQALMIQLLHQNSAASASGGLGGNSNVSGATSSNLTGGVSPVSASRANSLVTPNSNAMVESDHGLNPDSFEPPIEPDVRPTNLFSCLVCACYNTNNIEELNNHLLIDRSRNYNTDIMIISNSNYHCSLCKYNTNLKANFQLHSKTDKHIQKLNYINHIKEGGIKNEYKLKYNGNNSVQLKCNCCDYYTNSIQKLNLHTQNMRHENAKIIFNHLVYTIQECNKNSVGAAGTGNNVSSGSLSSSSDQSETGAFDNGTGDAASDNNFNQKVLFCQLCNYKAPHILGMVQHVKSLRHVQIEQIICLQRRSENADSLELVDVFKVVDCDDKNDKSSPQHSPVPKSLADQLSAVAAIQQHQQQLSAAAALGDQLGHAAAIFKCNHCNHFTETKTEIEQHLAIHHPNCGENDFFVIPTNTAQAAAAAAMAYQMAQSAANKPSPSIDDDIKSEKMDDDNGSDCGGDLADCEAIDTTDEMCGILCPLCQETFSDKKSLEKHVVTVHSVTSDGLARLLNLVDANQWMSSKKSPSIADCKSDGEIECTTCGTGFKAMMELLHHANDNQHYQMTSDNTYACVLRTCHANFPTISNMNAHFKDCHMNIVISERHVYKYRCKLCSLAFKTQDKLNNHSLYHTMRDATKCNVCNRNFRSTQSLQKHMDQAHNNSTSVSPTTSPGLGGDKSDAEENITSPSSIKQEDCDLMDGNRDEALGGLNDNCHETNEIDEYLNSQQMAEECYNDQNRKFKCHKCKMGFTQQSYLGQHYKSNVHRRNEKGNFFPMEKYLDPNRPFKCEICRESFTQKNILLVHYNSVSHLHKLKKQSENNNTPSTSPSGVGDFDRKSIEYDRRSNDVDRKSVDLDRKSVDFDRKSVEMDGDSDTPKRKLSPENDYDSPKKRFKCDICKVAYAQGSTLDIHMRSVLHQSRACRLQEQQAQLMQQQLSPGLQRLPTDLNQSQTGSSVSPTPSNLSTTNHEVVENNSPKINNQIYKTLLENFGFDIVKQFNEINKNNNGNPNSNNAATDSVSQSQQQQKLNLQQQSANAQTLQQQLSLHQQLNPTARSESASEEKYFCRHCKKIFSSIFVLKTHCEEIHNEKIPLDFLEKFAEKFKSYYLESAENENEILDFSSKKEIKEKGSDASKTLLSPQQQLLQQAQQQLPASLAAVPELAQKLNIDPTVLAQKMMEQNFANLPPNFANLPQNLQSLQSLQGLQNLQNLQNLPNMGNLPMNTLEMLNLMQFHHLMSLNFMNLAPPLIFGGTGASSSIPSTAGATGGTVTPNEISTNAPQQVQILQQQAAAAQAAAVQQAAASNNQKRARTRITDEQLKILRAHFDINNSPSEESIKEMSFKANLPPKVVKHWFRNTLFKERQRNKDSPYNFNNPPSTTLNLEEYERTGQTKVTSLSNDSADLSTIAQQQQQQQQQQSHQQAQQELQQHSHNIQQQTQQLLQVQQAQQAMLQQASQHLHQTDTRPHSHPSSIASNERPSDIQNARQKQRKIYENQPNNSYYESAEEKKPNINYTCKKCNLVFQRYYELIRHQKNHCFKEENNKKSAKAQIAAAQIAQSLSSEDSNSSIDINNASSLLSGNIAAGLQAQNLSLNSPNMLQSSHSAIPGLSTSPNLSMLSSQHSIFGKSGSAGHQSPQSTSSQQSPTQKYECDKCNLMFSRYELYKEHQLIHLMNPNLFLQQSLSQQYSENSPFGILQNLSSNAAAPATSSTSDTMDLSQKQKKRKFSETSQDNDHNDYDQLNKKLKNEQFEFLYNYFVQNEGADEIVKAKNIDFESLYTYYQTNELKKKGNFDFLYQYYVQNERPMDMSEKPSFEFLFQYYQINESKKFFQLEASPSKNDFLMMNLTSTPKNPTAPSTPTTALSKQQQTTANSSSGMLSETAVAATVGRQTPINQSMSTNQQSLTGSVGGGGLIIHNQNSNGSSTCGTVTNPADLLIQSMHQGEITSADKQNNKRLRTTILPEQLNFLYECYQNESNPSRKMLEEISKKVNLKKRVVQVWYQNSRARERKGQFRQNLQIINKKCPHCGAIFKIKSALESHLQTKHPDKQPINIDQIPDVKPHINDFPTTNAQTTFKAMLNDQLIDNNNKLSVSDFAQLMDATASILAATSQQQSSPFSMSASNGVNPLDLSTTTPKYEPSESEISFSDSNNDHDESNDFSAQPNGSFGCSESHLDGGGDGLSMGKGNNGGIGMSQLNGDLDYFGPCSPASSTQSQQKKRYRTQMSHRQVNMLKVLFGDYKTPSMIDCENVGREIGLPKRVVQVWFQNARAKDKKSRNSRYTDEESVSGGMTANPSPDLQPIIDDCKICGVQKVNMQEHVFSSAHIAQVKASIEGADLSDHHDDGQNLTKPQQSPTPASSISSTSSMPSAANMMSQQSSTHDAMGLYNQFLLQNHMFGQLSGALSGNQSSDQHQELLALQHHLSQQQQAALNNSGSSTSTTNGGGSQQPTPQQLLMENNLLLQINADNQPTTNSEILQQLYSYSQMSGELIK
ncbi:zinc finger protein 2 isoform X6 [Bradysia coprophila]|uniref:zinc finger protein 2 isoform X6 n=1 Tax=Bradysia coprophila TaxID=38358 RepID=UPI00187DCD07|nr:zinc finger protein 2 isoform X6 [Bradysia coprophila]